jgi:hypothetical protein
MSGAASSTPPPPPSHRRAWFGAGVTVVVLAAALGAEIVLTRPVRRAVTAYTALLNAANHQDLNAIRRLCSARYLATHPVRPAPEGGVVGLPRNIHKNFRAWRHEQAVWLCPTNRVGPLYQFVLEAGAWRFDGPVGILRGRGEVVLYSDLTDFESLTPDAAGAANPAEPSP